MPRRPPKRRPPNKRRAMPKRNVNKGKLKGQYAKRPSRKRSPRPTKRPIR